MFFFFSFFFNAINKTEKLVNIHIQHNIAKEDIQQNVHKDWVTPESNTKFRKIGRGKQEWKEDHTLEKQIYKGIDTDMSIYWEQRNESWGFSPPTVKKEKRNSQK